MIQGDVAVPDTLSPIQSADSATHVSETRFLEPQSSREIVQGDRSALHHFRNDETSYGSLPDFGDGELTRRYDLQGSYVSVGTTESDMPSPTAASEPRRKLPQSWPPQNVSLEPVFDSSAMFAGSNESLMNMSPPPPLPTTQRGMHIE